jgi:hypothetical protein
MITPELQAYVSQSRASGMSDDQIRQSLTTQGWAEADVMQALGSSNSVAKSNWFDTKHITTYIAIIIALGLVAYAVATTMKKSSKVQTPANQVQNNPAENPTTTTSSALDTSNWKTYNNICFKFNYPTYYTVDENSTCKTTHEIKGGTKNGYQPQDSYGTATLAFTYDVGDQPGINLEIQRSPLYGKTWSFFLSGAESDFNTEKNSQPSPNDSLTKITVDGQEAVKVYLEGSGSGADAVPTKEDIYFVDGVYNYYFDFLDFNSGTVLSTELKDFEQMIADFKAVK